VTATGVESVDTAGQRQVQHADVVILAAFAIQNPRILLNSATARHPRGLANANGLVGRYVMAHPLGNVFGLFREETHNYLGVTGGNSCRRSAPPKTRARGISAARSGSSRMRSSRTTY